MKPPFTQEIIDNFNAYQKAGYVHPYTCGNCSTELEIKTENMYCPKCDYTQTTIHFIPNKTELENLNPFPFFK